MNSVERAPITRGTRVLVRCDLDVPVENGKVLETFRLDKCLKTLKYIVEKGGMPVIIGHLGRPDGKKTPELSTKQLTPYFNERLGKDKYELLENLRFDPREKTNSEEFAKELSQKGEMYMNESFANSHREHTSIVGIPKHLPSYAGFTLQKEIETLQKIRENPQKPFVAIIGGTKTEDKKPAIKIFLQKANYVLAGSKIGLEWNEEKPQNLILPLDYVEDKDIGPKTIEKFKQLIKPARTILWAGPLGVYENPPYDIGTKEVAQAITENKDAYTVVGGGDITAALHKLELLEKIKFVSTGGGAMLKFLEKGTLPGVEALNQS
jgi:phosphoglycerate kinase